MSLSEFEDCVNRYGPGLRASLRARLRNEIDVDECLNRVFEKLWSKGWAVPPATRRAWLFVVTKNEAAWVGRKINRRTAENDGNGDGDPADEGVEAPLDSIIRDESIEKLRSDQRLLSAEQREVIRMRFYDDLPFREIAARLDIPIGTALSRARAAILRLRRHMDQTDEPPHFTDHSDSPAKASDANDD
jgi:RNA polymerase sigma-70 factor (ECF subfamily)